MISLTIFTIIILTGNHTKNNLRLITFSLCKLIIKLIIYNKKEFKFDTFALTFPCLLTLSNLLFLCEITLMIHFQVSCKTKGSSGILFVYLSYICSCVSHREREREDMQIRISRCQLTSQSRLFISGGSQMTGFQVPAFDDVPKSLDSKCNILSKIFLGDKFLPIFDLVLVSRFFFLLTTHQIELSQIKMENVISILIQKI